MLRGGEVGLGGIARVRERTLIFRLLHVLQPVLVLECGFLATRAAATGLVVASWGFDDGAVDADGSREKGACRGESRLGSAS